MGRKWLSGRRRQTVNLLVVLALVRIQLFSKIQTGISNKFRLLDKYSVLLKPKDLSNLYNNNYNDKIKREKKCIYSILSYNKLNLSRNIRSLLYNRIILCNIFDNNSIKTHIVYVLNLNFKRNRFFPFLNSTKNHQSIFNSSLGVISKFFSKRKSILRSKSSYILSSSYVRKVIIFSKARLLNLNVTGLPKFFKDVYRTITIPSNTIYPDPFTGKMNSEISMSVSPKFKSINFMN